MELKVSLDNIWTDGDYGETIANIIKFEIESAFRTEVKAIIKGLLKEHVAKIHKIIENEMRKTSAERLEKMLRELERTKE